jgi:CheY-like chemotaxis protein
LNVTETILLFNLSDSEKSLVQKLVTSFEIETVPLTIQTVRKYITDFPEKRICLVLFKISTNQPRQARIIGLLRDFVGPRTPILILVPSQKEADIRKYLQAGADDFIGLPINEDRFSISFLILLEMGQVIAGQEEQTATVNRQKPEEGSWYKIINYFQGGLSYFAPRSLVGGNFTEHLSDRWQQVKRIGIGGFGLVSLVKEIGSGRLAVAKTPHSSQMNIRVLRSAAILKRLVNHPNIAQLIEIIKESGKLTLIQEYVDGPTLQQLMEEPISPADRENYFLQLVSVVCFAHKHKILHRDIKPENILINRGGRLKLLDFGIARDLSWQPAGSSSEGTLNYMPPEQFEGKSCLASDVWALGVILYIFTTNDLPYSQENDAYPVDIETAVESRAPIKLNPDIPAELNSIILRCLEKDLQKRYTDACELQDAIQAFFPAFGKGQVLPEYG